MYVLNTIGKRANFTDISQLFFLGTDVRLQGDRARRLGWSPVHGIEEFYESIQRDAEAVLADRT